MLLERGRGAHRRHLDIAGERLASEIVGLTRLDSAALDRLCRVADIIGHYLDR